MLVPVAFILPAELILVIKHFTHPLLVLAPHDVLLGLGHDLVENVGEIFLIHLFILFENLNSLLIISF